MQLQLYGSQIFIYCKPIDFRMGINGLSHLVKEEIKSHPQKGIYLFYNRQNDKIKCLSWHKNGFVLLYKKLERGKFYFMFRGNAGVMEMKVQEVSWMLAGLEWQKMRQWRELDYDKFS